MKFKINLLTPDNDEKFVVEMSNATLTTIAGYQAKDADLTITINRSDLEDVMMGKAKLAEKVAAGKATMTGDRQGAWLRLASTMDQWDPWFEMVPSTKVKLVARPKTDVLIDDDPLVIAPN